MPSRIPISKSGCRKCQTKEHILQLIQNIVLKFARQCSSEFGFHSDPRHELQTQLVVNIRKIDFVTS